MIECYGTRSYRWKLVYRGGLQPHEPAVNYYENDPSRHAPSWEQQGLDFALIDQKRNKIVCIGGNWFPLVALAAIEGH